ncbi:MAG: hypothetical protein COC19_01070 [SAR86 cluster bacterium]|uniref:Ancillary SecYEG translocon subunit/Cell division coordinator CpoB TPR domain-containing protein n=1 Tax=SAR86 cluster bacterium TaxID=2030880 RepID=A0A2A4MUA2_9GAMM|nr:MAG: hypothetical protein COC19_01070 [SAR86 cluster bacterium]
MALDATEEENIEALKKWWDENAKQLIGLAVLVAAIYGGVTFWQNSTESFKEGASDLYEQILVATAVAQGTEITEQNRQVVVDSAASLKADYANTVYALYGALYAAQQAVQADDLSLAEQELRWLIDNRQEGMFSSTDEGLILVTNLRLGRVLLAKGDIQAALDLVNSVEPKTFEADYAELRGDIYVALERTTDAKDAYQAAQEAGASSITLQMKMDDLNEAS